MKGSPGAIVGACFIVAACAGPHSSQVARRDIAGAVARQDDDRAPIDAGADGSASAVDAGASTASVIDELPERPTERELFGEPPARIVTTEVAPLLKAARAPGIGQRPAHCVPY